MKLFRNCWSLNKQRKRKLKRKHQRINCKRFRVTNSEKSHLCVKCGRPGEGIILRGLLMVTDRRFNNMTGSHLQTTI